jgi:hypothetical protein
VNKFVTDFSGVEPEAPGRAARSAEVRPPTARTPGVVCFWCEVERDAAGEPALKIRGRVLRDCERHQDNAAAARAIFGGTRCDG